MNVRVPQDVDLEDRLLFGLTAIRFGELALACLCAVAAWRAIPLVGGPVALLVVAAGAAAAWTNWRGRGADHWLIASVRFTLRTYRIQYLGGRPRVRTRRRSVARPRRAVLRVLDGTLE